MEYERIHKVQVGIISPSKLRMKLMGHHHQMKKDGSNRNPSSRTSPSKLEDSEFVNNSLLNSNNGDFTEEVSSSEVSSEKLSGETVTEASQCDEISCQAREYIPRENADTSRAKLQQYSKSDGSSLSSIHPLRTLEDENLDYDSNASSSSFEFHKGERSVHSSIARSLSRPMSSKWNDAEKWIMNRQNPGTKKTHSQNPGNRLGMTNMVRVAPESAVKRVDFCQSAEKFSFGAKLIDLCPQSMDLKEVDDNSSSCPTNSTEDASGNPSVRAVSMRDMGTEMTPIPSSEPSRTSTPLGATTPLRTPTSSIPSSPRRGGGAPAPSPAGNATDDESLHAGNNKKELSDQELKLKTRQEIVALGVRLGKMNIAAWASKDEKDKNTRESIETAEIERMENEKRAAAWEDAEKCKHMARYKREEIRIQAWESQQKALFEAEMRRIEAQVEQTRAEAEAKIVKKVAMTRQRSEEKRVAAEVRKNREAEKTSAQAEYIRQTGRIPSSRSMCCGWL